MGRFKFFPILLVLFTGCATTVEFVRKDLTPEKRATLRYPAGSSKEQQYRDKLTEQARGFCGGEFKITREYEAREETGGSTGVGTGIGAGLGRHSGIGVGLSLGTANRNTAMYHFTDISCQ